MSSIEALIKGFVATARNFNRLMESIERRQRRFGRVDLYPSEIHTLVHIDRNRDGNFTALANGLSITKGALTKIIRKLEARSLITKFNKKDDQKSVYFTLTKVGQGAVREHEEFHKRVSITIPDEHRHFLEANAPTIVRFLSIGNDVINDTAQKLRSIEDRK